MAHSFIGKTGIVFIIIGVLGGIGFIVNYHLAIELSGGTITSKDAFISEVIEVWIVALGILLANLAVGAVLMALDKIIYILQRS